MSAVVAHVNIDLVPTVILLLLFAETRRYSPRLLTNRLYRGIILVTLGTLIADFFCWLLDGRVFAGSRLLLWICNILYMLFMCGISVIWFLYVYATVFDERNLLHERKKLLPLLVPIGVNSLIVLLSPWTHLVLNLDQANFYRRGSLFWLPYLVDVFYTLTSVVLICTRWRGEMVREKRRQYLYLIVFLVLPLFAMAIQANFYGWWLVLPFCVLAVLVLYLNIQNNYIATDGLTGLNNRGQLDKYLAARCEEAAGQSRWGLIIIDIDNFKSINDRFGHTVGDEAIWQAADLLRNTFGKSRAFLSRYGGDEFAVVLECEGPGAIEEKISALQGSVKEANAQHRKPYRLSLSVGSAMFDPDSVCSAEEIIAAADRRMYAEKERRRSPR